MTITFNNYEELIETLESIKGVPNIESVVINGGSCAKTKAFLNTYNGVSLSESDRGISDAFNKGVARSTGDGVMFLNSGDTLLEKQYIDWANDVLKNNPEIDYTYSDIVFNDMDLGLVNIPVHNSEKRSIARGMPYPHQSLIVRSSVFKKVGNFDESFRLAMDFDLILRMKKNKSIGKYYNHATVLMDGSGVSSKNDLKAIKETYKAIKKNNILSLRILWRLSLSGVICYFKMFLRQAGLTSILRLIKRNRYKI